MEDDNDDLLSLPVPGTDGFPPCQLVGVRRGVKPNMMVLFPPTSLSAVAASMWPSFLFLQVMLVWFFSQTV